MCRELPGLCTLAQVQQKLSLGLQQCNTQINKSARKRPGWALRSADSCKTGCIQESQAGTSLLAAAQCIPHSPLPTPRLPIMQGKGQRADPARGTLLLCGCSVFDHENTLRGEELLAQSLGWRCTHGWLHPGDSGNRPQLCSRSRSKSEGTAKKKTSSVL